MGGVNLAEEANSILGATDNVGSVIRSCKDESFLLTGNLHQVTILEPKENFKGETQTTTKPNCILLNTQYLKTLLSQLMQFQLSSSDEMTDQQLP